MQRWQNLLALGAVTAAACALLPLVPRLRLLFGGLAIAAILVLFAARLRAHGARRDTSRRSDAYERIERIRAQRGRRR